MRRRVRVDDESGIPKRLLRYDPADWVRAPGVDCGHPECAFWAGRKRWKDDNPDREWPSVIAFGPDVPFGEGTGHGIRSV